MLPQKRQPQRSGIERAPKREWPRHRKFVRSHECCVKNGMCCGPIEAAHVRVGTDGGISQKPSDWWLVSLCHSHHAQQHVIGEASFEKTHGIDMKKLAAEFAKASPDTKMKEAMRNA
jgi:hypothetical protein